MTDEFKKAFETAKTAEEKSAVLEQYKDEIKILSAEELERVAGGGGDDDDDKKWDTALEIVRWG